MNYSFRYVSILAFITLFQAIFIIMVIGNPIPVYPDLESASVGLENASSLNVVWVVLVFLIDFCINIFIVYAGMYLLHCFGRITNEDIFIFSKKIFLTSLLVISLVGLSSELIFGTQIIGLLLALFTIFMSYVLVAKYLLKLEWINGFLLALFALFVNVVFWLIIFGI
ncbi:MAG: hypothetical protein KAW47_02155 [Thermoplasmatales archaeon]|nr:hypothetical protein [Thermoplasmatales archaeon]